MATVMTAITAALPSAARIGPRWYPKECDGLRGRSRPADGEQRHGHARHVGDVVPGVGEQTRGVRHQTGGEWAASQGDVEAQDDHETSCAAGGAVHRRWRSSIGVVVQPTGGPSATPRYPKGPNHDRSA